MTLQHRRKQILNVYNQVCGDQTCTVHLPYTFRLDSAFFIIQINKTKKLQYKLTKVILLP